MVFELSLRGGTSRYGSAPVYHVKAGGRIRYSFELKNVGFAPVTLLGVRAPNGRPRPGGFAQLLGATVAGIPLPPELIHGRRINGASISGRGTAWINLTMRVSPCVHVDQGPAPAALDRVIVNYRILGLNQSQTIPLDPTSGHLPQLEPHRSEACPPQPPASVKRITTWLPDDHRVIRALAFRRVGSDACG